jgi:hypothetical protein
MPGFELNTHFSSDVYVHFIRKFESSWFFTTDFQVIPISCLFTERILSVRGYGMVSVGLLGIYSDGTGHGQLSTWEGGICRNGVQ